VTVLPGQAKEVKVAVKAQKESVSARRSVDERVPATLPATQVQRLLSPRTSLAVGASSLYAGTSRREIARCRLGEERALQFEWAL